VTSGSDLKRASQHAPGGEEGGRSRPLTHDEFIGNVQEIGALEIAVEADAAARAVLGALGDCLAWTTAHNLASRLPKTLRQALRGRPFTNSACGFSPPAFVRVVAENESVDLERAAYDTRAVLLALDRTLPSYLGAQLRSELAPVWVRLTDLPVAGRAQGFA
jgi:uncharacterized protein (DUF2267 family)